MSDEVRAKFVIGVSRDTDVLRALASAAMAPMTCGGHQSMGSLIRCVECSARNEAQGDLRSALPPDVVLALLDRLDAAEETR